MIAHDARAINPSSEIANMLKPKREVIIPVRYLPRRIKTLMIRGEVTRIEAAAAALFSYYEHHQWVMFTGMGTNFPRGYKVQTSVSGGRMPRPNSVMRKPRPNVYQVLVWALVEEIPFREIALRRGEVGARRTLHRRGKELLRSALKNFAHSGR